MKTALKRVRTQTKSLTTKVTIEKLKPISMLGQVETRMKAKKTEWEKMI